MEKQYKFVDPGVTRKELNLLFAKHLDRSLTQDEADTLYWLSECEYKSRAVILDLFKELASKIEE